MAELNLSPAATLIRIRCFDLGLDQARLVRFTRTRQKEFADLKVSLLAIWKPPAGSSRDYRRHSIFRLMSSRASSSKPGNKLLPRSAARPNKPK